MSTILFLNRSLNKSNFDTISIRYAENCFTAHYRTDVTKETAKSKKPDVLHFETHHDLLDYLEDTVDLVMSDADASPYSSIDLLVPGFPVVCLKPNNHTKTLLICAVRIWCKSV